MATRDSSLSIFSTPQTDPDALKTSSVATWVWLLLIVATGLLLANIWGTATQKTTNPSFLHLHLRAFTIGTVLSEIAASLLLIRQRNRAISSLRHRYDHLFIYAGGLVLTAVALLGFDWITRVQAHSGMYYMIVSAIVPLILAIMAESSELRWPATTVTGIYLTLFLAWHFTCFFVPTISPPEFPLLLIFPALALDIVRQSLQSRAGWYRSIINGALFLGIFLAIQWPFADFLMSTGPHNRFFGFPLHELYIDTPSESLSTLGMKLAMALAFSILMTGIGIATGSRLRSSTK